MTDTIMFSNHFAYKWHRIDLGAMKSKSEIPAVPPNNPSFSGFYFIYFFFCEYLIDNFIEFLTIFSQYGQIPTSEFCGYLIYIPTGFSSTKESFWTIAGYNILI